MHACKSFSIKISVNLIDLFFRKGFKSVIHVISCYIHEVSTVCLTLANLTGKVVCYFHSSKDHDLVVGYVDG